MTKNYAKLNLFIDFKKTQFWQPQITKKSQFLQNLTSPALTPYYSYRAQVYALRVILKIINEDSNCLRDTTT